MRQYVSEPPCFQRTYRLNLHWFKVREEMDPQRRAAPTENENP